MLKNGFVVAMAAKFSLAAYERPIVEMRKLLQWLIVSRCGPNSEFLTVANAEGRVTPEADAPIGLVPIKTAVGILMSEGEDESTFLLIRQRPLDIPIAGTFFPADGYARILKTQGTLGLRSEGRHAHSVGRSEGRWLRRDIPDPAPNTRGAMAWHIDALQRKWMGEFIG